MVNTVDRTIAISVANGVAVISTCFRLVHRTVKQRLWWDDFWALASLAFITCQWVESVNIPEETDELFNLWRSSYQVFYNFSLWTARLSLAVTIVRICPQGLMRKVSKVVAVLFGGCCVALTIWRTVMCALGNSSTTEFCALDTASAATETTFDVLADAWLIGAPIHMLCRMRLPSRHLRMLVAIFMLNILTTIACLVHAVFRQLRWGRESLITGNIQSATSLFVCNLLVLVTFLYRSIRGGGEATSVSEKSETVTHSVPQHHHHHHHHHPYPHPPESLPPPARTGTALTTADSEEEEEEGEEGSTCQCELCRYLQDTLPRPVNLSPTSTFPDLPVPPGRRRRRTTSRMDKDKDSKCGHPASTSTFPDMPSLARPPRCRQNRDRDSKRVPSEMSLGSLMPKPCNLSPTSTFPDLPTRSMYRSQPPSESQSRLPSQSRCRSQSRSRLPTTSHSHTRSYSHSHANIPFPENAGQGPSESTPGVADVHAPSHPPPPPPPSTPPKQEPESGPS